MDQQMFLKYHLTCQQPAYALHKLKTYHFYSFIIPAVSVCRFSWADQSNKPIYLSAYEYIFLELMPLTSNIDSDYLVTQSLSYNFYIFSLPPVNHFLYLIITVNSDQPLIEGSL